MDFELPEEMALLKRNVRRFVDSELIPRERGTNSYRLAPELAQHPQRKGEAARPLAL